MKHTRFAVEQVKAHKQKFTDTVYAVATYEKGVTGHMGWTYSVRTVRFPRHNIPYCAASIKSLSSSDVQSVLKKPCNIVYLKEEHIWDDECKIMVYGKPIELKRPDLFHKRGARFCEVCGEATREVLDGEAWCKKCERYQ